ncbi:hypothetical protein QNO00_13840 [Arthrobacter sp. zg-Y1219]|uniref:hypothetical protein n=1 Tax=Arthrobacter sp. zg-Y1219 TaxID=3049067 RepID=UPI0024C3E3CC|nr:hypothetical protein [Arthrobacter sp. zg-Y1219]MDK1361342.1 hypothetical protein [Arthrobacter sp. zg-Y1219]
MQTITTTESRGRVTLARVAYYIFVMWWLAIYAAMIDLAIAGGRLLWDWLNDRPVAVTGPVFRLTRHLVISPRRRKQYIRTTTTYV